MPLPKAQTTTSPKRALKTLRNSILLADALDALPTLPEASIDLTVFSPPYDGIRDYGALPPET